MKREYIIGLFAGLICLQIIVPVSMITKRESTLRNGLEFRFKTAPVDPYDAFRGRYVALRVEVNKVNRPTGMDLKYGQKVFAQLATDENGLAKVSGISLEKPKRPAYLMATVLYPEGNEVTLNLPIDRYYMEENAAPRAEQVYREHSQRNKQDAYVTVRVMDGFAVVEGLYVGDQRIEDLVRKKNL